MENIEGKKETAGSYVNELWATFEKTGSIGAYLLYNVVKEKNQKTRKTTEKNNTLQK
ncbi:MAG: hypothetical protein ABSA34_01610 [Candidatus Goldiibacteriota bacterium]|jgi:hypothetical protein